MESITNAVEKMRQAGSRAYEVGSLLSSLKRLTDKRKRRGIRYRLEVVVLLFIWQPDGSVDLIDVAKW